MALLISQVTTNSRRVPSSTLYLEVRCTSASLLRVSHLCAPPQGPPKFLMFLWPLLFACLPMCLLLPFFFPLETRSHLKFQAGLELTAILLPQLPPPPTLMRLLD